MLKEKKKPIGESDTDKEEFKKLILFNDEVNTFDFVIDSLVEVCEHDAMQAENCAMIAHYKGKCPVKTGTFNELKPLHLGLSNRQLTVEIQ